MASVRQRVVPGKGGKAVKVWIVDYKDESGKRRLHTPRPNTKEAAEKIARKLKPGSPLNTSFLPYTIADLARAYLKVVERKYANEEITRERLLRQWFFVDKLIVPQLGKLRARDLRPIGVQKWVDEMREKKPKAVGAGTIKEAVLVLRRVLTEGVRLEVLTRNVIADAPPHLDKVRSTAIEVPTKTELHAILGSCRGEFGSLVKTAIYTGMRQGELRALRWSAINNKDQTISVVSSAGPRGDIRKPKTKSGNRIVPVPPMLYEELMKMRGGRHIKDNDFVFCGIVRRKRCLGAVGAKVSQHPVSPSTIINKWQDMLAGLRLKPMHFHSLRHAAATLYIEAGLPPQRVKYLMGHSSIQMTFDTYGYLFPEDKSASGAAASVESLFQGEII